MEGGKYEYDFKIIIILFSNLRHDFINIIILYIVYFWVAGTDDHLYLPIQKTIYRFLRVTIFYWIISDLIGGPLVSPLGNRTSVFLYGSTRRNRINNIISIIILHIYIILTSPILSL